jgi:ABC-type multidrug transport system ATPase subunit
MKEDYMIINDIKKAFRKKEVLKGINLSIPRNSIYALLGHNGSGKTTLIRIILGLLNADSGNIDVFSTKTLNNSPDIGVVFDQPSLFDGLSAIDNLKFFSELNNIGKKERRILIEQELRSAGLWDRRNEKVKNWSTGMRQRLAIIRASLINHEILILDEPSSGLDPEVLTWLHNRMLEFKNKGGTIIFTTHNFDDVESVSDHVAILQDGVILWKGETSELLTETQSKVYEIVIKEQNKISQVVSLLENVLINGVKIIPINNRVEITWENNKPEVNAVIDVIRKNNIEIMEFKEKKKSLREVYLSFTRGER